MSDSTLQESGTGLDLASGGPQATTGAGASPDAGLQSGQVSAGWDPFEVWRQRIDLPRRRRAASPLTRSIP